MANLNVFYSRKSDDWKTPSKLYNAFIKTNYIDPCPYQSINNGLLYNFYNANIFINPPFSKISDWVKWGIKQTENYCKVVFLIPARTDTRYFHELLKYHPTIYFIKGRLKYNDSEKNAPFPTLLIILNNCHTYETIELNTLIERIENKQL